MGVGEREGDRVRDRDTRLRGGDRRSLHTRTRFEGHVTSSCDSVSSQHLRFVLCFPPLPSLRCDTQASFCSTAHK